MRKETSDTVYMVLDLLDSISRTSHSDSSFIQIDHNKFKAVKDELFKLMQAGPRIDQKAARDKKTQLIGILPAILIDTHKFPSNEDIVKLAEKSLPIRITRWQKKSRYEIIGVIIAEIAAKPERDLGLFFSAWSDFLEEETQSNVTDERSFVDVWLEFFNSYGRGR